MPLLPDVSRDTCLKIERSCIHDQDAAYFIKDVWEAIRANNKCLIYYWDHLSAGYSHRDKWYVPGMLAVSQLYRAFETDMASIPKVKREAFRLITIRIAGFGWKKFWQLKRNNFHYDNSQLSRVLSITVFEGVRDFDPGASQNAFDAALGVYIALEAQMEIDTGQIQELIPLPR